MKAGTHGRFVGGLDFVIDRIKGRCGIKLVSTPNYDLVATADTQPDPDFVAKLKRYRDHLDKELGQAIGTSTTALYTHRA